MNDVFFKLIRSGLYGTELNNSDLPAEIDWNQLIYLAQKQTLQGVMADAVMRLPSSINVPLEVKQRLMDSAFQIAKSHSLLDNKLAEIVKFYRENSINTILLKGQGIARCYRNPLMRQCGDIDLYVGSNNYEKACKLAQEKLESQNSESSESSKHYEFHIDHVSVELHRMAASPIPIKRKAFLQWIESEIEKKEALRHIEIKGEQISLPSPLFDAFFIFYHAWRHLLYYGIGLRQICDWTMLLDKYYDQIDKKALERALQQFQLMRPWQMFGNIAVDYLGLPKEKMPFYNTKLRKKSKRILDIILECGNFGYFHEGHITKSRPKSFLTGKIRSAWKMVKWYSLLFPIVPKESTLKFVNDVPYSIVYAIKQVTTSKK